MEKNIFGRKFELKDVCFSRYDNVEAKEREAGRGKHLQNKY